MESKVRASRARARFAVGALGAATFVAACGGGEDDYANKSRPPEPIVISAAISNDKVSVSPRRFGAGPVTLIVSNQTDDAQKVTLETDELGGTQSGTRQRTGPINPGDTASIKADLRTGSYRVAVEGDGIDAAAVRVGRPRPSSQNELLQP
jgi:hypothetical protein